MSSSSSLCRVLSVVFFAHKYCARELFFDCGEEGVKIMIETTFRGCPLKSSYTGFGERCELSIPAAKVEFGAF